MLLSIKARAIMAFLISAAAFSAMAGMADEIEWRVDKGITQVDKADILQLARRAGIKRPKNIAIGQGGDKYVYVSTGIRVRGERRRFDSLIVIRKDWFDEDSVADQQDGMYEGRWWTYGKIRHHEGWRIHDGDWYIDIGLSREVSYANATRIVRAIRQRTLINGQPKISFGPLAGVTPDLPTIEADLITAIERDTDHLIQFVVTTTNPLDREMDAVNGNNLYVEIRDGHVVVVGFGGWVS